MASDNVLAHYDPEATLILTVDASPTGLGAVLSQVGLDNIERPVSYASRTLTPAEKQYAQIQREATAIIFGVRRFHQYLFGRSVPFVLRTDQKPLLSIFGPHRGIPEVSANRLQRYAIFLSAYNYTIEYVRSSNNSADYLSRAPLPGDQLSLAAAGQGGARGGSSDQYSGSVDSASYVNFVLEGDWPVTSQDLRRETCGDRVLSKVKEYVLNGWPRTINDAELKPYFNCRLQLSFENDYVTRGHKVVIPSTLRETICKELHSSHFGIVKMKAEARKRLWFPGIDATLERLAAGCPVCAALRPAPPHAPLAPWPHPPEPFDRIHVDFLGPFHSQMYLIIVDAYSKWVECYIMSSKYGSQAVVSRLCDFMSRVGIPRNLVSDNGSSFTSEEFNNFCKLNGIKHLYSPAYHPSSNGQAESMVKVVKKGLKSIILTTSNKKILQERIAKFLFDYRNSVNSTTGKSPAELVYGKPLRSRLDLLRRKESTPESNDLSKTIGKNQYLQGRQYKGINRPDLKENEAVWVTKNITNQKFVWMEGLIRKKVGSVLYLVHIPSLNCEVTRHIDQIRKRTSPGIEFRTWDPNVVPDLPPSVDTSPHDDSSNQSQNTGEGRVDVSEQWPCREQDLENQRRRRRELTPQPPSPEPSSSDDDGTDCASWSCNPRRRELTPIRASNFSSEAESAGNSAECPESSVVESSPSEQEARSEPSRGFFSFWDMF